MGSSDPYHQHTSPSAVVTLLSGPAVGGSIDEFELFYTRRALDGFRTRLGRQGLLGGTTRS